jgi:ABC-type nitrate/sulfonate/bicarbonate transport system permease component
MKRGFSPVTALAPRSLWRWLATATIAVALWESLWIVTGGLGFSHSWEVLFFLLSSLSSPQFTGAILSTLILTLGGLVLGLGVAVIVGGVIGTRAFLETSARGTLYFARAIPSIALIPLLMATMGSRLGVVIVLVTWLVATKLVLFVVRGIRDLDKQLDDQIRVLQLSPIAATLYVRIPAAAATVVTGLRLTVNRAYGGVILGGLLAGTPGIGRLIQIARINSDSEALLSYAVLAGFIGLILFWGFGEIERLVVKWRPVA